MTIDEIKELVSRVTYKPGYLLKVNAQTYTERYNEQISLSMLTAMIDDVRDPESRAQISYTRNYYLADFANESQALYLIRSLIIGWEQHEADEWLKLDGVQLKNPHAHEVVA